MKNWERIGCPTYVRPSGRLICVGLIWPHSPFPSPMPRRIQEWGEDQGSSGYLVRNVKEMQALSESDVLAGEEKRLKGIWNVARRNQDQPSTWNLYHVSENFQILSLCLCTLLTVYSFMMPSCGLQRTFQGHNLASHIPSLNNSYYLLSTYSMPGIVPWTGYILAHLILTTTLCYRYYCPYFIDDERGWVLCPGLLH